LKLKDLGSDKGTFHNGRRVEAEEELTNADTLTIGPVTFVIRMDDQLLPDGEASRDITIMRDEPTPPERPIETNLEG
jgi:pSer/pThr/pTyr-binding forkhead associated (FHA) protein